MEYLDYRSAVGADPYAVIASTLCMMSCTMQSGCRIYLPRIVENLDWLAAVQSFDASFRTLCRRLAAHWDAEVNACAAGSVNAAADCPDLSALVKRAARLH